MPTICGVAFAFPTSLLNNLAYPIVDKSKDSTLWHEAGEWRRVPQLAGVGYLYGTYCSGQALWGLFARVRWR